MCCLHAVADNRCDRVEDVWIIWCRAYRPGEGRGPCWGVGHIVLDEADEVVVDLAGDGDHVIVGVVEDWVEYLRHFEDVIVRWLATDAWMAFCCFFE